MPTIETFFLPEAEARVAKVNKRAAKLGVEGVTLQVSEPYTRKKDIGHNRPVIIEERVVDIEVVGPVVKFDGWTFAAAIDHAEGLVMSAPGVKGDFRSYADAANCDHCGHSRDRNKTYVLIREDGLDTAVTRPSGEVIDRSIIQVGSTCIKDFLGHSINLYFTFEAADDLDQEFFAFGSGGESRSSLMEVLTVSDAVIRSEGWTPRSKAFEGAATADTVGTFLYGRDAGSRALRERIEVTDESVEIAEAAREWALGLSDATNDYLFNLHQIANNDYVTPKSLGLAVSLIAAYRREIEKEIERKIEREQSSPVPVTDDRIRIEGTVVKVGWKQGFGYYDEARKVITVRDDRGFKLWGTCPKGTGFSVEQGDRIAFNARVEVSDRNETFGFFKRPTKVSGEKITAA